VYAWDANGTKYRLARLMQDTEAQYMAENTSKGKLAWWIILEQH
jgi:hypothetical protein